MPINIYDGLRGITALVHPQIFYNSQVFDDFDLLFSEVREAFFVRVVHWFCVNRQFYYQEAFCPAMYAITTAYKMTNCQNKKMTAKFASWN